MKRIIIKNCIVLFIIAFIFAALIPTKAEASTGVKVSYPASKSYLRVKENNQIKAVITDSPDQNAYLKYKSSNSQIVSVSKTGVLKGKKPGVAKVAIIATEGVGGKTKTITKNIQIRVTKYRHISHRGLQSKAPPNSEKAYDFAGKANFWGMEADIRVSKPDNNGDVQIYVCHDTDFFRSCGVKKEISKMTAAEIDELRIIEGVNAEKYNQKVCTLDAFLDICKKYNSIPYLDVKEDYSPQVVRMITDKLAERGLLKKARLVGCYDSTMIAVRKYARTAYGKSPSLLLNCGVANQNGRSNLQQVKYANKEGFEGVSVYKGAMTSKIYSYCKSNGMEVNLWTYNVNEKSKMLKHLKTYKSVYSDMVNAMVE